MPCRCCGVEGPTQSVHFEQNIGMVVTRLTAKFDGELCRRCLGRSFRSYTLTTLFLGWWGLISFFMTPIIILTNTAQWWHARNLPEPGLTAQNIPFGAPPPRITSGSFGFKITYGLIVWTVVAGIVAYNHVSFTEKHAPALNAALHNGEITDEAGAEYVGLEIGKDIAALEADYKGNDWAAIRPELLSRERFVNDLKFRNTAIQDEDRKERAKNAGANDVCEALVLNELDPAVQNYSVAWSNLLSFAKKTPVLTPENGEALDALSKQEGSSLNEIKQYFSDSDNKGCK